MHGHYSLACSQRYEEDTSQHGEDWENEVLRNRESCGLLNNDNTVSEEHGKIRYCQKRGLKRTLQAGGVFVNRKGEEASKPLDATRKLVLTIGRRLFNMHVKVRNNVLRYSLRPHQFLLEGTSRRQLM